jgi:hypothetical protein
MLPTPIGQRVSGGKPGRVECLSEILDVAMIVEATCSRTPRNLGYS